MVSAKGLKPSKDSSAKRHQRLEGISQKTAATRQLSCVSANRPINRRTAHSQRASSKVVREAQHNEKHKQKDREREDKEVNELVEHLKSIAPFNKRWQVIETINQGTYGVVFSVQDVVTKVYGVIKVAKSMANEAGNISAEWEGFVLENMFKRTEDASIVRLLDKGMLADQRGEGMEFVVQEKASVPVKDYIYEVTGPERRLRAARIVLQMLKGIYDLHSQGLLHRDLKPDNMGLISRETPVALIFDLGMARMYTDGECDVRPPRTCCPFRGTPEWASGHAQKGREQTRFDDLIAWMYVACELFATEMEPCQPLPWTYRSNFRAQKYLKSVYCPARYLLKNCPPQFYSINAYLMTANTAKPPNYRFLADRVQEAVKELEAEVAKLPQKPAASKPAPLKSASKPGAPTTTADKKNSGPTANKSKGNSKEEAKGNIAKEDPKLKSHNKEEVKGKNHSDDAKAPAANDVGYKPRY